MFSFSLRGRLSIPPLLLLVSLSLKAQAQTGISVIGTGCVATSNGETQIVGTFGQSIIGPTATPGRNLAQGFWFGRSASSSSAEAVAGDASLSLYCLPNPLKEKGTIRTFLPESGRIRLSLYDLLGREVSLLADENAGEGEHEFSLNAQEFPSGEYRLVLLSGEKRMTLPIRIVR